MSASVPSPHLISIEDEGVVSLLEDFEGLVQKRIAAEQTLASDSNKAMMNLNFMT